MTAALSKYGSTAPAAERKPAGNTPGAIVATRL